MTYRDPSWGKPTKMALGALLLAGLWYCTPSSVFFKPINMAVIKNEAGHWIAVSERRLPWGKMNGKTDAYIQVLGREDGPECQWHTESEYVPRENNVTRYDITEWAAPCLDLGPPISVHFSRTIYLFDVLPLRPVEYSFTLNPEAAPVVDAEGDVE